MKKTFFYFCLGILAFGYKPTTLIGQITTPTTRWAVQLNAQQQDVLVELYVGQLGVYHDVKLRPFVSADVQHFLSPNPKSRMFLSGQLGYFHNLYHEHWISSKVGLGWERTIYKGLFFNLRLTGGMASSKNSAPQYQYENGEWVAIKNRAQRTESLIIGPRLDLGYRLLSQGSKLDVVVTSHIHLYHDKALEFLYPYRGLGVGLRYSW